jgi:uncharacterized protein with LGFP repeats
VLDRLTVSQTAEPEAKPAAAPVEQKVDNARLDQLSAVEAPAPAAAPKPAPAQVTKEQIDKANDKLSSLLGGKE